MASDSDLVTLADGLVVPLPALQVLWRLEDRGLNLQVVDSDIIVRPSGALTDAERGEIRRLKPHIVALLVYCNRLDARQ
jgi:hypothetical protein